MRFIAPARGAVDPEVFCRPPLSQWRKFGVFEADAWPGIAVLNRFLHDASFNTLPLFVAQTPELLRDGLHYEQRIAKRGEIATRQCNWHDLLNALIWIRFPALKSAMNARQVAEIVRIGVKQRSRVQQALTHFDEAGVIVLLRDPALLGLWDVHDWHSLFWRERSAWRDGRIDVIVCGHALLEHALRPDQLLVGKAVAMVVPQSGNGVDAAIRQVAETIRQGGLLNDPQELRPLPLSGIPGWHDQNEVEDFYRTAPCLRPLRAGRRYPAALQFQSG